MAENNKPLDLVDKVTQELQAEEAKIKHPSVFFNILYALKVYDSQIKARISILLWVFLVTSALWSGILLFANQNDSSSFVPVFLATVGIIIVNLIWYSYRVYPIKAKYRSPNDTTRALLVVLIPSVIWGTLVLFWGILSPLENGQALTWLIWGIIAVGIIMFALSQQFKIWYVSLEDGAIRYHLPHLRQPLDTKFVQQKHPDDPVTKEFIKTLKNFGVSGANIQTFLDFRGDSAYVRKIYTDMYNFFEQYLLDMRDRKLAAGEKIPPELQIDAEFTNDIETDRRILEGRLIQMGMKDKFEQLRDAEKTFKNFQDHLRQPGIMPPPFMWIKTLDTNHQLWRIKEFHLVKVKLKDLQTKDGGATFDLDVSFKVTFDPNLIELPRAKQNMRNHASLAETKLFITKILGSFLEIDSSGFFTKYPIDLALTKGVYEDFPNAMGGKLLGIICTNFGIRVLKSSVTPKIIIDEHVKRKLIADANIRDGGNVAFAEFLKSLPPNLRMLDRETLEMLWKSTHPDAQVSESRQSTNYGNVDRERILSDDDDEDFVAKDPSKSQQNTTETNAVPPKKQSEQKKPAPPPPDRLPRSDVDDKDQIERIKRLSEKYGGLDFTEGDKKN